MPTPTPDSTLDGTASEEATRFWRALLYRWFVEYNPLYLLSAALVLAGCFLCSRDLVREDGLAGPLGIALVSELYAVSLMSGAALLIRIHLPRPAVMLALLFVLYQWDITLHTETCAYLGGAGAWATAVWLGIFVGKLAAVGWALRLRLARRVVAAALVAAVGLALGPRVLPGLEGRSAGALLAVWLFTLATLYSPGGIASTGVLDGWGHTVLRRVTRVAWLLSGVLVAAHVLIWWRDHNLSLLPTLLAAPLLFVRSLRSEARVWATVAAALVVAAEVEPSAFFVTALLAATSLALRAVTPTPSTAAEHTQTDAPYRLAPEVVRARERASIADAPLIVTASERVRLLTGALFAAYLAAWTLPWSNGSWPLHVVPLDIALTVVVALVVWRARAYTALVPLAACYVHVIVQARLLPLPQSSVAWGGTAISLGFALLAGSLFTSYRLRGVAEQRRERVIRIG